MRFKPLGLAGQERLSESTVLLVGVGALGTWLASILVRAGVGRMILVDRDVVELHNLQRQLLYTEKDVGSPKAIVAAQHLAQANSSIDLVGLAEDFSPQVFSDLGSVPDLILDGTDNFPTRYLINDLAMRGSIPWIYGGAVGAKGSAMVVLPGTTPCLRCLLPDPPTTGESETCETVGVLTPTVTAVTAFQSAEALKILSGNTESISKGILTIDVWRYEHEMRMAEAGPAPHCSTCRGVSFPALEQDWVGSSSLCGRDAVQVLPRASSKIDLQKLAENLREVATDITKTDHLLRFAVEHCRFSVFPNGRALLFGIDDAGRAQILFDRYVGA